MCVVSQNDPTLHEHVVQGLHIVLGKILFVLIHLSTLKDCYFVNPRAREHEHRGIFLAISKGIFLTYIIDMDKYSFTHTKILSSFDPCGISTWHSMAIITSNLDGCNVDYK